MRGLGNRGGHHQASSTSASYVDNGPAGLRLPLPRRGRQRRVRRRGRHGEDASVPSPWGWKHLASEFPAVFLFLWDPSIDAANWRAEQAIQPAVVIRKVCGGNRTRKGADTQQVLSTVVRTAPQRGLDLPTLTAEMFARPRARHSRGFRAPAAAGVAGVTAAPLPSERARSRGSAPPRRTHRFAAPPGTMPAGSEPRRATWRTTFTYRRRWLRRLSRQAPSTVLSQPP